MSLDIASVGPNNSYMDGDFSRNAFSTLESFNSLPDVHVGSISLEEEFGNEFANKMLNFISCFPKDEFEIVPTLQPEIQDKYTQFDGEPDANLNSIDVHSTFKGQWGLRVTGEFEGRFCTLVIRPLIDRRSGIMVIACGLEENRIAHDSSLGSIWAVTGNDLSLCFSDEARDTAIPLPRHPEGAKLAVVGLLGAHTGRRSSEVDCECLWPKDSPLPAR